MVCKVCNARIENVYELGTDSEYKVVKDYCADCFHNGKIKRITRNTYVNSFFPEQRFYNENAYMLEDKDF